MKVINPITVTDSMISSTNLSENDHPEWDPSTTYAQGDKVIVVSTHTIYESAQGSNLDNDPTTDDGTWWIEISATNAWKAFDSKLADKAENTDTITYEFAPPSLISGVVLFNVQAAEVTVKVQKDGAFVYDETKTMVDASGITDWFTFFTEDLTDKYVTSAIFTGFTVFPTDTLRVEIGETGSGDTVGVGEISLGKVIKLGETLEGTEIGLTSFSTKEQDSFGNWTIVSRAKSDPVDFTFAMAAPTAGFVKRTLDNLRDVPAVYFADESLTTYGALTFGLFQDYSIPLQHQGKSVVNLEIEGLT